jgi:hypothetical protein
MGFVCGPEVLIDSYMELSVTDGKPDTSSLSQWVRLLDLRQPDDLAEEAPGIGLTIHRCGNLNVVEPDSQSVPILAA